MFCYEAALLFAAAKGGTCIPLSHISPSLALLRFTISIHFYFLLTHKNVQFLTIHKYITIFTALTHKKHAYEKIYSEKLIGNRRLARCRKRICRPVRFAGLHDKRYGATHEERQRRIDRHDRDRNMDDLQRQIQQLRRRLVDGVRNRRLRDSADGRFRSRLDRRHHPERCIRRFGNSPLCR